MALISDYHGLRQAVAQYKWKTGDTEFNAAVDGMIQMAGARLNRKLSLRVMETDAPLTGSVGSRALLVPSDFVEAFGLSVTTYGDPRPLRFYVSGKLPLRNSQGSPDGWSLSGGGISLDSLCDHAHTFQFSYRKSLVLSEAQQTNWLIENHPDIYLAAVCIWGGVFLEDPSEADRYKAILEEGIEELAWIESRSAGLATLGVDAALTSRGTFNINNG